MEYKASPLLLTSCQSNKKAAPLGGFCWFLVYFVLLWPYLCQRDRPCAPAKEHNNNQHN